MRNVKRIYIMNPVYFQCQITYGNSAGETEEVISILHLVNIYLRWQEGN